MNKSVGTDAVTEALMEMFLCMQLDYILDLHSYSELNTTDNKLPFLMYVFYYIFRKQKRVAKIFFSVCQLSDSRLRTLHSSAQPPQWRGRPGVLHQILLSCSSTVSLPPHSRCFTLLTKLSYNMFILTVSSKF